MTDYEKLEQLAVDFATTMTAFDAAHKDTDDLIGAVGARLKMERSLAASRAAELGKTANDPSRSETVRRVAAAELAKLQAQVITTTQEESAALAELVNQQQAAIRDLKKIQQAAKPAFEAAAKQLQAIRSEILGSQRPDIAPRWIAKQQTAFEKLSAGGGYNE